MNDPLSPVLKTLVRLEIRAREPFADGHRCAGPERTGW